MNLLNDKKQQLIDHAETLHRLASEETPPLIRWQEIALLLEESATFLETFVIPKVDVPPRYTGGVTKIAPLVVPERPDLEVKPEDSSAGPAFLSPVDPDAVKANGR